MILKELTMSDFGIYAGKHSLRFHKENDSNKNIILIGGMNGRGKTTILEAILLVLYGNRSPMFKESNMSYSAYLKKCINKASINKRSFLELTFQVPVRDILLNITVNRSWEGFKQRVSDHLKIWRDDYLDQHLSKNWDVYLEELLPVGISSLFFFDAEKISRLAEEEETSETMKESIKTLLGIDIIDRLILDMKKIIQKKQKSLNNLQIEKEEDLQNELQNTESLIGRLNQEKAQLNLRLQRKKIELQNKEEAFIKKGGALKESRNSLLREKEDLHEKLLSIQSDLIGQAIGPLPLLLVTPLLENICSTLERDEKIKTAKHVHKYLKDLYQKFLFELNSMTISNVEKEKIIAILTNEQQEIKNKQANELVFDLSPVSQQHLYNLLDKNRQEQIISNLIRIIEQANRIESRLEQTEGYLLIDTEDLHTTDILNELKKLHAEFAEIELKQKNLSDKIIALNNKKAQLEVQILKNLKTAMETINSKSETERVIQYALLTQEKMAEFKKKVVLKKVFELSERIAASFLHIIGKEALVSKITIDPETLKLSLYDTQGDVLLKSQLSAGEKQMLAIAILWGLAQSSGHKLPVIIDTPLGRLDSSHRKNFITHYLPNASHQVIVLSTDEEMKDIYLQQIEDKIQYKYLLEYDDRTRATSIVRGYFRGKVS